MEENLLKYFTGQGTPTTEDIKPINIKNGNINGEFVAFGYSLVTNDNSYFIKYGGFVSDGTNRKNVIEIYSVDSIKNQAPILTFSDLKINGHTFQICDMHQDIDGRFYALGLYYDNDSQTGANYLILFNNFVQDGEIKIRKYYTNTTMDFSLKTTQYGKVIKNPNSADYYMFFDATTYGSLIHFKIDINLGNSVEKANITSGYTSGISWERFQNLYILNNALIYPLVIIDNNNIHCLKFTLDLNNFIPYHEYSFKLIKTITVDSSLQIGGAREKDYKYYIPYLKSNGNIEYQIIDFDGNTQTITYTDETYLSNTDLNVGFSNNYVFITNGSSLKILYYNSTTNSLIEVATQNNFIYNFTNCRTLKQFNIEAVFNVVLNSGLSSSITAYCENIYSIGYTSEPYYNNNFFIPQYLNLYSDSSEDTSVIFSRDTINRFLAGNQLTSIFNVPNYLLNDDTIEEEKIYGQTNLAILDNIKDITKNRFESLYLSYMNSLTIKDNTNGNNLVNIEGSNRLADSIWNTLDYQQSPCLKARITYDDETQEIINLSAPTITDSTATFTYQVEGNINKIEYLSNDTNTVYATYRCNLTGTNTITQTIEVEEG